jgi:hypothetical protein
VNQNPRGSESREGLLNEGESDADPNGTYEQRNRVWRGVPAVLGVGRSRRLAYEETRAALKKENRMDKGCLFWASLAVVLVVVAAILNVMADGMAIALWGLTISVIVFWLVIGGPVVVGLIRMLVGK